MAPQSIGKRADDDDQTNQLTSACLHLESGFVAVLLAVLLLHCWSTALAVSIPYHVLFSSSSFSSLNIRSHLFVIILA
jgi:hypothetical protein